MDITLALGGGGSRGVAHIGVLKILEANGFKVRALAGTSIGAIVAALYASGRTPAELEEIFSAVDQTRLYGWPLSDGPGLLGVRKIAEFLKTHLGELRFEELKLPCAVVAVDLKSNKEIVLQSGRVVDAILGSIAVPGLFPPKEIGDYLLIDGGSLDPVPVRPARALAPRLPVVAVTLLAPPDQLNPSLGIVSLPAAGPIVERIDRLKITQAFRIFTESMDIVSRQMSELRLNIDKPDVVIRPELGGINLLDKVDIHQVSALGETAALKALPDLKNTFSPRSRGLRWVRGFAKND